MSEYQYVEFRAVDRPLTDAELRFAEKQSTRAEISRWTFSNEYHFGDFRGDVNGLLRRGYDVYLHYANFGIRTSAFRLPAGMPFPKFVWSKYVGVGELTCTKDRKGKACILKLNPQHDPEDLEEIWDPDEYMEDMVEVRGRLLEGDLRGLYVLWLCAANDAQSVLPDVIEPPVPGGLSDCVELFGPFLEFFGLDPLILVAASEGAPVAQEELPHERRYRQWAETLSNTDLKRLVCRFLAEDADAVKAETMPTIQQATESIEWPTASLGRSLQMLLDRTDAIRSELEVKEQKKTGGGCQA